MEGRHIQGVALRNRIEDLELGKGHVLTEDFIPATAAERLRQMGNEGEDFPIHLDISRFMVVVYNYISICQGICKKSGVTAVIVTIPKGLSKKNPMPVLLANGNHALI